MATTIETLLAAANTSDENDSSVILAKRLFLDEAAAQHFFDDTRTRMTLISEWKKSSSMTDYEVFDAAGKLRSSEPIEVGRFIRIVITGTGKYDWVRVEEIIDRPGEFIIAVRPSDDPTQADEPGEPETISHFFGPESRNHFCLQLDGKTAAFYVIGLNEKQNTEFTGGVVESARNAVVANLGYYSGLQDSVWEAFCKTMLQIDEKEAD